MCVNPFIIPLLLSRVIMQVFVEKLFSNIQLLNAGSVKANGGEPKSCLGQVLNFKLSCFCYECD